jgi:hypothetical protein
MTYIRRYLAGQQATTVMLGEESVTEDKIATGAVAGRAIKDASIGPEDIKDKAILLHHLGDDIPVYNIPDGAITEPKISDGAVSENKIKDLSVTTPKIDTGAVTAHKIATGAVETAKLKDLCVTPAKLAPESRGVFGIYLLHIQHQEDSGVSGGDFISGDWRTRPLNTVLTNEIAGASLNANQITLPAGTYFILAKSGAFYVNIHKAKLYNVSDAEDVLIGTSEYVSVSGNPVHSFSVVNGRFSIDAPKTFELQHRCGQDKTLDGFGAASFFDVTEVYADVLIWKVK